MDVSLPVAIGLEPNDVFSVQVPDLPGCFSVAETIPEAIAEAEKAIALYCDGALPEDLIPKPVETHREKFPRAVWAFVSYRDAE